MVMDVVNSSLSKVIDPYRKWIIANPHLLTDLENLVRCLPYFTAGRFSNSAFATELIYSMPHLLVLFNDLLMYSSKCVHLKIQQFESKIKIWLTVVEYTETLFEISAKKFDGERGKWLVIGIIQTVKAILRLLLVYAYKERITKSPPIQPLNREKLSEPPQEEEGFTLKRSGAVVRSIRNSRSIETRMWESLSTNIDANFNCKNKTTSEGKLIFAESLYIIKPLLHLGCMSFSGREEWPPWLLSLAIDLISLKIFNDEAKRLPFTKEEQKEILRRRLCLILYILRSPFYDKYSRKKINAVLDVVSKNVPLARFLTEPIKKCLPHWQSTYFYMWSC